MFCIIICPYYKGFYQEEYIIGFNLIDLSFWYVFIYLKVFKEKKIKMGFNYYLLIMATPIMAINAVAAMAIGMVFD